MHGAFRAKEELNKEPAGSVLDKIDLRRVYRIECFIEATLGACLVDPCPIDRNDKGVIIHKQEPSDLFEKVACRHELVWIIEHVLKV